MSNFVIAVGGSGAKLLHTLIHLGAAGLLPEKRREIDALVVDPDDNNGNVEDFKEVEKAYQSCRNIKVGSTDLFSTAIRLREPCPWTPMQGSKLDSLKAIFHYAPKAERDDIEADLLDLMYEDRELNMSIKQGFRGRPAIGATILAHNVDFRQPPWSELRESIKKRGSQGPVHVLFAGSVFGGSGAAGVPTLVRLIDETLQNELSNLRLGLTLFLPFFQFKPVPGEEMQADPSAFPTATAEALKYYHERHFLAFCHSIYALGEEIPSDVAFPAVGAADQRNEPHFMELVAGMGAMRFFGERPGKDYALAVASRANEKTVTWADLPSDEIDRGRQIAKLQQMAVFAVAFRYIFYPKIMEALNGRSKDVPFWVDHVEREKVPREAVGKAIGDLFQYIEKYLRWLLHTSTPRRNGFEPGMVDPNIFGAQDSSGWRLKTLGEFNDSKFGDLILNRAAKAKFDYRSVYNRASDMTVKDSNATGPGRLVRALYDACQIG